MPVERPPSRSPGVALRALALALAWVATGCPVFDAADAYRCDSDSDCPPGRTCGADNVCALPGDAGEDPVDAGSDTTDGGEGTPDAGEPDAGGPDAGEPDAGSPAGSARLRFVNAGEIESHDFWLSVNGGVEQRAAAALLPSRASEPVVVGAGIVTVFATSPSPVLGNMPFPQAQQQLTLVDGAEVAVTLAGGIGPGSVYSLVRTDFLVPSTLERIASFVHASRGIAQFALDTNDDGTAEAVNITPGSDRALGPPVGLGGPRFGLIVGPGFTRYFSPFEVDSSGVLFVLSGRVDVPQHAPDSIRLIQVPRQDPSSIVLNDAWVTGWNLLSPGARTELRVDGHVPEGTGVPFGELMSERQVPPKPVSVELWRTDGTPQQLKSKLLTLERGEVLLAIAYGNPANSADFVPFIDRTPRPVGGAAFNVVNATGGGILPTLVVKSGTVELVRDGSFSAGKVAPMDFAGLPMAAGTLQLTLSAAGLPLFESSFTVAVAHGERLLFIVEESGGNKPNLRVIRNLGPTQQVEVLSPD